MIDEEIIKKRIERFIESGLSISKGKDKISDKLHSLLKKNSSLKKKIYDARIADIKTRRNLISEILEEVKHPILSSIFHTTEAKASLKDFSNGNINPELKFKKKRYRKVIKCSFEE